MYQKDSKHLLIYSVAENKILRKVNQSNGWFLQTKSSTMISASGSFQSLFVQEVCSIPEVKKAVSSM